MNRVLFFTSLYLLCQVVSVHAAQYQVQGGDVIGIVSQKTNCSIEQLAALNNIGAPEYTVRVGTILRYVSEDDMQRARAWIEAYMASLINDSDEYKSFARMLHDIENDNIQYDETRPGTYASEILLLASVDES